MLNSYQIYDKIKNLIMEIGKIGKIGKISKFLLGLLFVLLIVEIIVIAPKDVDNNPSSGEEETSSQELDSHVKEIMRGVHLVKAREDEGEWELWADTVTSYKQQSLWELQAVKTRFFGQKGVYFIVAGEKGTVQIQSKDMTIMGNVTVRSSNGYIFRTESVKYGSDEHQLWSSNPVTMRGPKDDKGHSLFLSGQGFKANMTNSLIQVFGNVRGKKVVKNNKHLLIQSQSADFSSKSNLARFRGDVVMDFETMRITGPQAVFEYEVGVNLVKSVQVSGGVKVSDLDKWATSQRVKADFNREFYVFRGNPKVVQNNDELEGEEIIFLNGGRQIEVLKARVKVDKTRLEKAN